MTVVQSPSSIKTIRQKDLLKDLGITKPFLNKLEKLGKGPKRIVLGRAVLYRISDVQEWLDANQSRAA